MTPASAKKARPRDAGIVASVALFLPVVLWPVTPSALRPLLLATCGLAFIAALAIAAVALQERSDAGHAAKVRARNEAVEADPVRRQRWERWNGEGAE